MKTPDWYTAALLALASFRIWRLLAEDVILNPVRAWAYGVPGWRPEQGDPPDTLRVKTMELVSCPWCLGFWLTGGLLAAYWLIVGGLDTFGFLVTWFAISAAVGLLAKL